MVGGKAQDQRQWLGGYWKVDHRNVRRKEETLFPPHPAKQSLLVDGGRQENIENVWTTSCRAGTCTLSCGRDFEEGVFWKVYRTFSLCPSTFSNIPGLQGTWHSRGFATARSTCCTGSTQVPACCAYVAKGQSDCRGRWGRQT